MSWQAECGLATPLQRPPAFWPLNALFTCECEILISVSPLFIIVERPRGIPTPPYLSHLEHHSGKGKG